MTLLEKQWAFSKLMARLLDKAHDFGFEVVVGEVERSQAAADAMAAEGKGISKSLHRLRLAVDLLLFQDRDGDGQLEYLQDTSAYEDLGEWWEQQSEGEIECCWGGRFERADGDHFSISHGGIK